MEGLFFAIGFLLGGVLGVLIMCLLQINRIGRKEDSEELENATYTFSFGWTKKRQKPSTKK